MTGDQLIEHTVSGHTRVEGVGRLHYVRSPDHEHWHFLGFMRYELRHAGKRAPLVRDRKTGFCLGDRYRAKKRRAPSSRIEAATRRTSPAAGPILATRRRVLRCTPPFGRRSAAHPPSC